MTGDLRPWQQPLTPEKVALLQEQFRRVERYLAARDKATWDGVDWVHLMARQHRA